MKQHLAGISKRQQEIMEAIIKHARSVILVTDSMKLERKAFIRICNLSDVDCLVTDNSISEESLQMCESRDVHLRVVSISDDAQKKGYHVG